MPRRFATIALSALSVSPSTSSRSGRSSRSSASVRSMIWPDARAEAGAVHAQLTIRRAHAELFEEDVAQAGVVVLPGVDEHVVGRLIEALDHAAEADDLGPGAEDREDLHTWNEGSSCTSNPLRRSSSSTPARSSRSSSELYSGPSNGTRSSSSPRSSGRIGPTAR